MERKKEWQKPELNVPERRKRTENAGPQSYLGPAPAPPYVGPAPAPYYIGLQKTRRR